jgi:hypothetical protein
VVNAIERPATVKNKGCNVASSRFWNGFHAAVFSYFPHTAQETSAKQLCDLNVTQICSATSISFTKSVLSI